MTITSINPATSVVLERFEEYTPELVEQKLQAALHAFRAHRRTSFTARAKCMQRAGEILLADKQRLGRMMTEEMGKTLKSAVAEAEKCALACRHYAQHAEAYLRDEPVSMDDAQSYVRF